MIKSFYEWEPELQNKSVKWLNALSFAIQANRGNPVKWDYKNLQDRFRKFKHSNIEILDALQRAMLIKLTQDGHSRKFEVTNWGLNLLAEKNYQKLLQLLTDKRVQKRNKDAIAHRKKSSTVYEDATLKIIDDFRFKVKFEKGDLLKQLQFDRSGGSPLEEYGNEEKKRQRIAFYQERYKRAVFPLLSFETRIFCDLDMTDGFHEFQAIPEKYRQFASVDVKPYLGKINIGEKLPTFLRELRGRMFPALHAFGENLGLTIVYVEQGIDFFGDTNDKELKAKFKRTETFIKHLSVEHSSQQIV